MAEPNARREAPDASAKGSENEESRPNRVDTSSDDAIDAVDSVHAADAADAHREGAAETKPAEQPRSDGEPNGDRSDSPHDDEGTDEHRTPDKGDPGELGDIGDTGEKADVETDQKVDVETDQKVDVETDQKVDAETDGGQTPQDRDESTESDEGSRSARARIERDPRGRGLGSRIAGVLIILACFIPGICLPGFTPDRLPARHGTAEWDRGTAVLRLRVVGPDGLPVPGADVWLMRDGRGPATRTNADGLAVLKELAEGPWTLWVESPGLARHEVVLRLPLDDELLITLKPGTQIKGIVRDQLGEPIAGAEVLIRAGPDGRPFEAITEEDGTFSMDTLPTGSWQVEVAAPGYERVALTAETQVGTPVELNVELRRAATLRGIVRKPSSDPAPGAAVVLAGSGIWPPRQVHAGDDGRYELTGIPEGVYELRARHDGYVSWPREGLSVLAGQTLEVDLQLVAGRNLAGRVIDRETGEPIVGANVLVAEEVLGLSPVGARTGTDGRFFVTGLLDRPHRLSVSAEGYVSRHGEAVALGSEVEVKLQRGAVIEGRVIDHLHRPVEGARIDVLGIDDAAIVVLTSGEAAFRDALFADQLTGPGLVESGELGVTFGVVPLIPLAPTTIEASIPGGAGSTLGPPPAPALGPVTDHQGRFRIVGLPPGRVQLVVTHLDHGPAESEPMQLVIGEIHSDVEIVLPEGAILDGRVVDARGFGVGAVWVEMQAELETSPRSVMTAEDGTFELRGAVGAVTLTANPTDLPPARIRIDTVSGKTHEVEITIDTEVTTWVGEVVDPAGQGVAGALISLSATAASTPLARTAITEEDGTFSLGSLPSPPYRVEVDHPDFALLKEEIRSAERALLRLAIGGTVKGQLVEDRSFVGIGEARIQLLRGREKVAETISDDEGRFGFSRIMTGTYTGRAEHETRVGVEFAVRLEGRRGTVAADIGEIVMQPGGSIAGQIVDRHRLAVKGAQVAVGDPPDWNRSVSSDEDGQFRLPGLEPGSYRLIARHVAAGVAQSDPLRVRAGEENSEVEIRLPESQGREVEGGGRLRTGIAVDLVEERGRVFISRVIRRSSAERAGLREGDRILAIDDQVVGSQAEAERLLRGAAGVEAHLDLRRAEGGQERIVVVRERHVADSP